MVSHRLHIHEVFSLQVGHSDTGDKVAPQPLQHRLFGIFNLSRRRVILTIVNINIAPLYGLLYEIHTPISSNMKSLLRKYLAYPLTNSSGGEEQLS